MKPYQRGDVVIIDVPMLANSHIQAGKRPWVVVQNNVGNQFSSTSIDDWEYICTLPPEIMRHVDTALKNAFFYGGGVDSGE